MANVKVYNIEGKEVGTIELNDAVFGVEVNEHLLHRIQHRLSRLFQLLYLRYCKQIRLPSACSSFPIKD